MKFILKAFAAALLLLSSMPTMASPPKPVDRAKAIFDSYQALESAFDARVADLYCDTALIRNTRTYPDGNKRTLDFPAPKYKELIRSAMPLAKAAGDSSTYSDVTYAVEGAGVRILSTRYSHLKDYESPLSILVGSCNGGDWAILEELSESQP